MKEYKSSYLQFGTDILRLYGKSKRKVSMLARIERQLLDVLNLAVRQVSSIIQSYAHTRKLDCHWTRVTENNQFQTLIKIIIIVNSSK